VGLSNFIGVDKIVSEVGKKNFVISLAYSEGSIEKVSYNIEGDNFNLVIEPRAGHEPFNEKSVKYSYQGAAPDVIVAVDTIHLGGLKKAYEGEKELFASKPVINIDRHPNNAQYGQLNLVDPKASSTSELVAQLLSALGVSLTADIATNLLNSLYGATNSFQASGVTHIAFELAAACLKAGGKRFFVSTEVVQEELPHRETAVTEAPEVMDAGAPREEAHEPAVPEPTIEHQVTQAGEQKEAPADWLKPKIFKSSNLG
jgi:c-di-AMP phosphodiesterase-like protein